MNRYLIVFDRPSGSIIKMETYQDASMAMQARATAELQHAGNSAVEVVVLTAKSDQTLLRTHARYFRGVDEIAKRLVAPFDDDKPAPPREFYDGSKEGLIRRRGRRR